MERTFGENLKNLMESHHLSGRELSRLIGVPYKTVQEWIGGGSRIPRNPEALRKLADYFKCSVHYLLFGEEDPQNLIGSILEKSEIHTGLYEISIKRVKAKTF